MIEAKTLLIVGAGASVPYGYPTGNVLKEELFDPRNLVNLQNKIRDRGIELFCQHFEESQQKSIDAFLANRGRSSNRKFKWKCLYFWNVCILWEISNSPSIN
jgi:hypothetical protein